MPFHLLGLPSIFGGIEHLYHTTQYASEFYRFWPMGDCNADATSALSFLLEGNRR